MIYYEIRPAYFFYGVTSILTDCKGAVDSFSNGHEVSGSEKEGALGIFHAASIYLPGRH
jgi:hypothetical protein